VLNGAGSLEASGTVPKLAVTISGAGDMKARDLAVLDAQLTISGAGGAVVRVSDTLQANMSRIGSIEYLGDPRVTSQVSGIGTVKRIQ
jgi:hypothetical protein